MPRAARPIEVGGVYHVINRAALRLTMFTCDEDYKAFAVLFHEAREAAPSVDLLAYCIMQNHWHLLLKSNEAGDIRTYMHKLTGMHTIRYHKATGTVGFGPLYQGRYKSFLVDSGEYFLTVLRYVECNARRAHLVSNVEEWLWGSAYARTHLNSPGHKLLSRYDEILPGQNLAAYYSWLNAAVDEEEREKLRPSLRKGLPFGREQWVERMVEVHRLKCTTRGVEAPEDKLKLEHEVGKSIGPVPISHFFRGV